MHNKRNSVTSDLSFLSIIVLCFLGITFLSINSANIVQNSVMLCITSSLLIITYTTTIAVGLIANAAVVFLFLAYNLIQSARLGIPVSSNIYFWIIWMPLLTVAVAIYCHTPQKLLSENNRLHGQLNKLATVDDLTELKNIRGFDNDAQIYMKVSKRYNMKLVLMLWRLRFPRELEMMIGKEAMPQAIQRISDVIRDDLRTEDVVYLLDDKPYLWGTLLFTNPDMISTMVNRVKQKVYDVDLSEFTKIPPPLDLIVGYVEYNGEDFTPFAFLGRAKEQLELEAESTQKRSESNE